MAKKSTKKKKSKKKGNGSGEEKPIIRNSVKKNITAIVLIMLAIIFFLSLFGMAGIVGERFNEFLNALFGYGKYVFPIVMLILGGFYFKKMKSIRYTLATIGAILFLFMFLGLIHIFNDFDQMVEVAKDGKGGGYVGLMFAFILTKFLGKIASAVILVGVMFIGIMLLFNAPIHPFFEWLKEKIKSKKEELAEISEEKEQAKKKARKEDRAESSDDLELETDEDSDEEEDLGDNIKSINFVEGPSEYPEDEKPKKEDKSSVLDIEKSFTKKNIYNNLQWKLPPFDLLEESEAKPQQSNLSETVGIIKDTFQNFGIDVEPSEYHVGPTVTQFTFRPAVGVKLSRILALHNDLALALAAHPIRIEAPIPGKSLIGIEVPNKNKSLVRGRTMFENDVFKNRPSNLSIIWGENVNGQPILADIMKMPHLMIAGSTGTGKSVCINVLLTTLLYQNSPEDLRLILVDPKRVELSTYEGIPHLLTPVIVDTGKVVNALKWAVNEMDRRYRLLQEAGVRNIQSFNEKAKNGKTRKVLDEETGKETKEPLEKMPFIVIMIDELADLMATHSKEVEGIIVRLAQMARAVGIHLVVSTQRPSVEVLTGLIKANITTRIAFQVATQIDSRTILDGPGANKLLGNGDLLYLSAESSQPMRIQGVFVSEQEVKKVVKFVKSQAKEVNFDDSEDLSESLDEQLQAEAGIFAGPDTGGSGDEELYSQAKDIVIQAGKGSTSMLQRRLGIGYSRAARIIDMLEEGGIVGPAEGSKAREVLVGKEEIDDVGFEDDIADQAKREKWG